MSLDRFLAAQAPVWATARAELRAGAKRGHWMWFIFPQLAGLGRSEAARLYAIADLAEARAYLAHSVLGARLREGIAAMMGWAGQRSAEAILGGIDAVKLRSCCTLFEAAAEGVEGAPFATYLDAFHAGQRDPATLALLEDGSPAPT